MVHIKTLEGKGVEWDGNNSAKHMWDQVKQLIIESAREVGGKNPNCVWWNDEVKVGGKGVHFKVKRR